MSKTSVMISILVFLLLSCDRQSSVSGQKNADYVVFHSYYNGFIPTTSEIRISSDSIVYQIRYLNGSGPSQGYPILSSEFNGFWTIIDTGEIVGMPDPVFPADSGGCASDSIGGDYGHKMWITLHSGNLEDTIDVSSCFVLNKDNRRLLPDGLHILYDYADTLCARYPKQ